ncbi:GNAT family N-acetyltransferase [Lacisediminihabitans profunda]|uniref:GNAT family N-acetyltransferase n=1 Tax=Lacisediminihabitans profunda TaxID=2594790 RepID=A0A5C8US91_9MICO|nr:GNAT family N-acetyltransferase [Lacisediminihabitans profunda]TXN30456.1 GNAT family N-acetyltransferase [Lacisediminihabitans profunda]
MTFSIEPATAPGVTELLRLSDEFAFSLYPADSCYLLDVSELTAPGVTVVVARSGDDAVGVGALVERGDGSAELKRMFVRSDARGRGIASGILTTLEGVARGHSIATLQLETGPLQPEAIALYEKHGYRRIPAFGQYVGDDFSVCMAKTLG